MPTAGDSVLLTEPTQLEEVLAATELKLDGAQLARLAGASALNPAT
jgi:hypothetical protein